MSPVTCPSCGEKGNVPDQVVGKRIKCPKCGGSFVTGATPTPPTAAQGAPKSTGDTIEVDGLDLTNWAATAATVAPVADAQGPEPADGPSRQYKVLTQKDRWFEGKFELARLEDALNHYARQGWVVRAMSTPLVAGFSGAPREEIVVLLER